VLTQTMSGVLDTFRDRVPALAEQVETQLALRAELQADARGCYAAGLSEFDEATRNGSLLRGEILARWQDFTGTGDLLRMLQVRKNGRQAARPRKRRVPARAKALKGSVRDGLETLVTALADRAAEDTMAKWQRRDAGAALIRGIAAADAAREPDAPPFDLDFIPGRPASVAAESGGGVAALTRSSADLATRSARAISAWQDHVMDMVRAENVTKRSVARVVSFDDESLALVLTIGMLGYAAGGVTVTEGTSAVPQRLLTSLFGAGQLRDLGARARLDLHEKISVLFGEEMLRFAHIVSAVGAPDDNAASSLRQASETLEEAR
jgi:hypothetical protein